MAIKPAINSLNDEFSVGELTGPAAFKLAKSYYTDKDYRRAEHYGEHANKLGNPKAPLLLSLVCLSRAKEASNSDKEITPGEILELWDAAKSWAIKARRHNPKEAEKIIRDIQLHRERLFNQPLTRAGYSGRMATGSFIDNKLRDIFADLAQAGIPENERAAFIAERAAALSSPAASAHLTNEITHRGEASHQPEVKAPAHGSIQPALDIKAGITGHAPRQPKPLPEGLSWPQEDFDKAPEYGKWGGLARYLERTWRPLIPYIDMPTLREHWPRLGEAIDRQRSKLPKDVPLPRLKEEVVDQELRTGLVRIEDAERLSRARRRRVAKARQATPAP
jgi:hypothetical protein